MGSSYYYNNGLGLYKSSGFWPTTDLNLNGISNLIFNNGWRGKRYYYIPYVISVFVYTPEYGSIAPLYYNLLRAFSRANEVDEVAVLNLDTNNL
jgi:hypothetical protein